MIQIERVSEDIYVFTSELYVQVTAGAIVSPLGTALIDTLPFPIETFELKEFIEERLGSTVRYIINTHYHADHTYGSCFFPGAQVVAHARCRELLDTRGRAGLEVAKEESPDMADVEIVLPEIIFDTGHLNLHLGNKTLTLAHSPGHSPDSITVLVREDRILFAADTLMPIPFISDGDVDDMIQSLEKMLRLELENAVQGHGEVVLRGEIAGTVKSNIKYLRAIRRKVVSVLRRGKPKSELRKVDIESVGKSRIALGGLAPDLHWRNLSALYDQLDGTIEPVPRRPRRTKATAKKRTVSREVRANSKQQAVRTKVKRKMARTRAKADAKKKARVKAAKV